MLNHGLNYVLLLSLSKVFGWKYTLDWIENSGLKSRMLYCLRFQGFTDVQVNLPENSPSLSAQMTAEHLLSSVYITWNV